MIFYLVDQCYPDKIAKYELLSHNGGNETLCKLIKF